jgi:threonine/homoserine/homoserine lactone efflux protein
MDLIEFAITVILISASGVIAPGPLFVANLSHGIHGGLKTGIKIATGHAIIEFPLIILLGIGVLTGEKIPEFKVIISIIGALALFIFAIIQIKTTLRLKEEKIIKSKNSAIIVGITLSALNPFFIFWWLGIGFKLISDAMMLWAFEGLLILFFFHIWMDFVWLGSTAYFASKSLKIISSKNYKILMIGLSIALIYFGIAFLLDVI